MFSWTVGVWVIMYQVYIGTPDSVRDFPFADGHLIVGLVLTNFHLGVSERLTLRLNVYMYTTSPMAVVAYLKHRVVMLFARSISCLKIEKLRFDSKFKLSTLRGITKFVFSWVYGSRRM